MASTSDHPPGSDLLAFDYLVDISALSTEGKPTQERYACPNLWYHTHIYWDGRIAMCDRDFNLAYDR